MTVFEEEGGLSDRERKKYLESLSGPVEGSRTALLCNTIHSHSLVTFTILHPPQVLRPSASNKYLVQRGCSVNTGGLS